MLFYTFRSLVGQWRRTALVILIVAIAAGTFLSLAAALQSFTELVETTSERENLVALPSGGFGERWPEISHISPEALGALRVANDIAQAASGEPLVSPEVLLTSRIEYKGRSFRGSVRGVDHLAFEVHRSVTGAVPVAGVIVGGNLRRFLDPIAVGDTLRLGDRDWPVVGFFEPRARQTQYDSEIWAPLEEVMHARNMRDYSVVTVRARSASEAKHLEAQLNQLIDAPGSNVLKEIRIVPEETLGDAAWSVRIAFHAMFLVLSSLILVVATLGTLNVLLQGVLRRRRHIALFRAMGFTFREIAGGLVFEGAVVAFVGALLGVLMVLPLSGTVFVIGSVARPGVTAIALRFTAADAVATVAVGTAMGVACALLPTWYAKRFDVKSELRAE